VKTSDNIAELAAALAKAQGEMKNPVKNATNPHYKNKYVDLAGVRDTVVPVLAKHGISVVQMTSATDTGLIVATRLMHTSGQWLESTYPVSYDKPQAMGSAITYARRYSLSAICCIAADDDDDANAANDKPVEAPQQPRAYDRNPIVRREYERLERDLIRMGEGGTLEDVITFWKDEQPAIKAMPADWLAELTKKKDEIKTSLQQRAA
jgi:hypothetical protein